MRTLTSAYLLLLLAVSGASSGPHRNVRLEGICFSYRSLNTLVSHLKAKPSSAPPADQAYVGFNAGSYYASNVVGNNVDIDICPDSIIDSDSSDSDCMCASSCPYTRPKVRIEKLLALLEVEENFCTLFCKFFLVFGKTS